MDSLPVPFDTESNALDPLAWQIYADWLGDKGRTRSEKRARKISEALASGRKLVLVKSDVSAHVPGRAAMTKIYPRGFDSWRFFGWLTPSEIHSDSSWWPMGEEEVERWATTPLDWKWMKEMRLLTWKYFVILSRGGRKRFPSHNWRW